MHGPGPMSRAPNDRTPSGKPPSQGTPGDAVPETASGPPWRPWPAPASLGFALALVIFYFVAQALVAAAAALVAVILDPSGASSASAGEMFFSRQGLLLAVSVILTAPAFSVGVALLAHLRGPIREYLALRWTGWKSTATWTLGVAVFLLAFDSLGAWLGRPPVPDFMLDVYNTADPRILLWVALVVLAPLFEELLFRGFLIPGLETSWGGPAAVGVSSLLFAVIHFQYDLFDMTGVLGLGLIFGAARVTTRSTLLPMALHAGVNFVATAQTHWLAGG